MLRPRAALVLVAALALAACARDDGGTSEAAPPTTTGTTASATTPPETTSPPTVAPDVSPYVSEVYADPANWICRPDVPGDPCDADLALSEIGPEGTVTPIPYQRAVDPPIDCFYVYPTTSEDRSVTSDLVAGVEAVVARNQAGRFSQVCDVYAPMYPSVTLAGLFAGIGGGGTGELLRAWETAYEGVRDAWHHYLANDNEGRPVVLIGHSQGTGHLIRLLADEVDDDPVVRDRVLSAILLGGAVAVPPGEVVGGVFDHLPLCTSADETGCVLTYASFSADAPPGPTAYFGAPNPLFSANAGGTAGCTNPAELLGETALRSAFGSADWAFADPASATDITTPFMGLPGLVQARCATDGERTWLEVSTAADPADARTDTVPSASLSPDWGLHAIDMELAQESLVELVRRQAAARAQGS